MNDKPIREDVGMELNSNYFVPDHKNWSYDEPNYYVSRVLYSSSNWAFINDDLDIFPNRKILEKKKITITLITGAIMTTFLLHTKTLRDGLF